MNLSRTIRHDTLLAVIGAFAVTALCFGCAATAPPPPDESQLMAAGFKVVVAKTALQREHLQSLPPGKVTELQRTGTHYFVYPDAARNQIYVGTPKEYQAYLRLRPAGANALATQQPADMASYIRQDDAMQKNTNRDLADPYYFWDSFDGLGWR